jgi:MFS superfamily sulfate permease-like transporter
MAPRGDLDGLRRHWRADAMSGFLVFLIALPLSLGIAMASGAPPAAGLISAIGGGILAGLLSRAEMTIKGPAAGMIVIVLGAVTELGAGDPALGFRRMLAVGVVAGIIQMIFGLARAGRLGDFFPVAVVHGMLAAIGLIIISKQLHLALGVLPEGKEPLHLLAEIPHSIANANPAIAVLGAACVMMLLVVPLLPWPRVRASPGPVLVLLLAVPAALALDFAHDHDYALFGRAYHLGPRDLVSLPASLASSIVFPDFSVIASAKSIQYVVMFALVGTLESLLSAKAVDLLDPWRRTTNLDRDLFAVGAANTAVACVGGLPMITEIVRSSANVNNGGKTRFANAFHGIFLLVLLATVPSLLGYIPVAALAAMLVVVGFRLASPREFRHVWHVGPGAFVAFAVTLVVTIATDLLVGVGVGLVTKLIVELALGFPASSVFRLNATTSCDGATTRIDVRGGLNFTNWLALRRRIERAATPTIVVDLAGCVLLSPTVSSKLEELTSELARRGVDLDVHGFDELSPIGDDAHTFRVRRAAVSSEARV